MGGGSKSGNGSVSPRIAHAGGSKGGGGGDGRGLDAVDFAADFPLLWPRPKRGVWGVREGVSSVEVWVGWFVLYMRVWMDGMMDYIYI